MGKILSRSGESLADLYDVEGSIAGIDQLETRELPIVHEMGNTLFSERLRTRVFRVTTGAILQDVSFRIELDTLPETPCRLLGLQVISDNKARILRCAVYLTDPSLPQDFPVWVLSGATPTGESLVMEDAGTSATFDLLEPIAPNNQFPSFTGGREQGGGTDTMVSQLTLQGRSTGFGAGSVVITALALLAFPARDVNISSRGLPIPSW